MVSYYIWSKILHSLEESQTLAIVDTFFRDVQPIDLSDTQIVLHSRNMKSMLEAQCIPMIQKAVFDVEHKSVSVLILNDSELTDYLAQQAQQDQQPQQNSEYNYHFNREFIFDTFVVGTSNKIAFSAARAVAERPGKEYNPLYIYGPSGLGKTHLLSAIANEVSKANPDARIAYVKGDDFTNAMVQSINERTNFAFRDRFRNADLLLFDDVQFLAGRDSSEEEFFHSFNTLYENGKQIVLTSDVRPEEINKLEDRLKTRFSSGLMVNISPPDYETRVAIILRKAKNLGLALPDDVINYIAENITSNVRQLEGTVNKLRAYHDINDMELTLFNVKRAITDMYKETKNGPSTPQMILAEVAAYYDIDSRTILGSGRAKKISEARQIAMYLTRSMTTLSLEDIGKFYGKDHTTVMYSIDKIETGIKESDDLAEKVKNLTANINGKTQK